MTDRREDQLIPELIVRNGPAAIEFYKRAFGAEEVHRMMTPDGTKLAHAELTVDGHKFFVCDEFDASQRGTCKSPQTLCDEFDASQRGTCKSPQTLGGTGVRVTLFVDDADATVQHAISAGARVNMPVQDMFWGARYGKIVDPFGHEWGINQQVQEQTHVETRTAADEFFSKRRDSA
ncbi:MAG TPA: VOC family protein [Terriglobales bacterium]|nr:VOC family protein [Terriglobales bacterium]